MLTIRASNTSDKTHRSENAGEERPRYSGWAGRSFDPVRLRFAPTRMRGAIDPIRRFNVLPCEALAGVPAAAESQIRTRRRWKKADSNYWSLSHESSVELTAGGAMAGNICHVCFRRTPRINLARDSAIAPGQPHPQRQDQKTDEAARALKPRAPPRPRGGNAGACSRSPL
jgi:hypothetical protein